MVRLILDEDRNVNEGFDWLIPEENKNEETGEFFWDKIDEEELRGLCD